MDNFTTVTVGKEMIFFGKVSGFCNKNPINLFVLYKEVYFGAFSAICSTNSHNQVVDNLQPQTWYKKTGEEFS